VHGYKHELADCRNILQSSAPQQVYDAIEDLTGQTIEPGKNFYIEEFDNGGMSGGMVCSEFWLTRGMDFLVARHRELSLVVFYFCRTWRSSSQDKIQARR
jgi:hypothetical protein